MSVTRYVPRDDPRYYDLRWFGRPDPGQHWAAARLEQVAAIKAKEAELRRQRRAAGAAPPSYTRLSDVESAAGSIGEPLPPRLNATVGRDDPRYWDLDYWPTPAPGQSAHNARREQEAAILAAHRAPYGWAALEDMLASVREAERLERKAAIERLPLSEWPIWYRFPGLVPSKPYCTDYLGSLQIRPRGRAAAPLSAAEWPHGLYLAAIRR